MPLLVVYNPVCGSRSAKSLTEDLILPLLYQCNVTVDLVVATKHAGHVGELIADYLRSTVDLTLILVSGDGTLHEVVNNRNITENQATKEYRVDRPPVQISVVLVPAGTANALYSSLFPPAKGEASTVEYKLKSLKAFLDGKEGVPLSLGVTTLLPPAGEESQTPSRTVVSGVVTSTALHASILYDSEKLRHECPGIKRFKVAAQQNGRRWYDATVRLLPESLSSDAVQMYDPVSGKFMDHPESKRKEPTVEVTGPFIYFLSTINVDRLELEFRITPLARTLPSGGTTYDIVIVRPLRDPSINEDDEVSRERYAIKIWEVMQSAYADGSLTNLRYDETGQIGTKGNGPLVVEYVRCGGWEWIPVGPSSVNLEFQSWTVSQNGNDERAMLVCADGEISTIPIGGKAVSVASTSNANLRFAVCT